MKEKLPAEKLENVWDELNINYGKFFNYTNVTEAKSENYNVFICYVILRR
jgi:hypothetical protein